MSRRTPSLGLSLALATLLIACGGGGAATTTRDVAPIATTSAPTTTAATTTAAVETTTTAAATTTSGAAVSCPEASDPPEGWRFLSTPLWTIYHPAEWEDLSAGAPPQTAEVHFDEETVANSGVDPTAALPSYVLASPDRAQAVILTQLDGVTDSLEDIYQRAEDRYEAASTFEEMVSPAVADCLGGVPAMYAGFFNQGAYQQSWFALTGDTLFHADFFGETVDDGAINSELFSTLTWNEPLANVGTGAFIEAAMASQIDTSATGPDPSWYTETFTTADSVIYAVFRLEEGTSGDIQAIWTYEDGQVVLTHEFFFEEGDQWGYMGMTAPSDGFAPGDYQLVLTLDQDAARYDLSFTVTEP